GFREGRYSVAWLLARADEEAFLHDPAYAGHGLRIPEIATTLLMLNAKRGPLADEAVRSRFVEAFDVDQFIRRVEGPAVVAARGLIPPGLVGYEAQGVLEPRTLYDVATGPVELSVAMT